MGGYGGIQATAAIAADALRSVPGVHLDVVELGTATHGRWAGAAEWAAAGYAAMQVAWRADLVVVWHVGLLKLLLPAGLRRQTRVVVFLHGIEAWQLLDPWSRLLFARRIDTWLSNSDYTYERFAALNRVPATAGHSVVALGIGEAAPARSEPSEPPAAIVVGRLEAAERYKGHRELIEAWPNVGARVPGAQLWVVGDGDLRPELEQQARSSGVASQVRFWGEVPEETKQDLLRRARASVMPSRAEGFGLAYVEAMRWGRPCLVSLVDAGREVVRPPECGLAVDPGDPDALAAAVVRLLTPGSEWDAWSANARKAYEASFTERHFRQRLLAALDLLSGE